MNVEHMTAAVQVAIQEKVIGEPHIHGRFYNLYVHASPYYR